MCGSGSSYRASLKFADLFEHVRRKAQHVGYENPGLLSRARPLVASSCDSRNNLALACSQQNPLALTHGALGAGSPLELDPNLIRVSPKQPHQIALICKAIMTNANLSEFVSINSDQMQALAEGAYLQKVACGEQIIKEGDLFADRFYIVEDGEFSFEKKGVVLMQRATKEGTY